MPSSTATSASRKFFMFPTQPPLPLATPANIALMLEPSTPVQFVKGIGPRLAEVLAAKGVATVDDLLHYLPFRYEARLNQRSLVVIRVGVMEIVIVDD